MHTWDRENHIRREGREEGREEGTNLLSDALVRLKAGVTAEELLAEGVDSKIVMQAESLLKTLLVDIK